MSDSKTLLKEWMELWRLTDNVYTQYLKRWNLSLNAFFVLSWLRENPDGVEPAQLADKVNIQRQLVTIILRDFESRGLILRKEQKADHRRKRILLSKQGVLFANEVCEASDTLDLHGLAAFTPAEQEKLLEYSRRFYNAIRNGPDGDIRSAEKRA